MGGSCRAKGRRAHPGNGRIRAEEREPRARRSRLAKPDAAERRTLRWREMDSNRRSPVGTFFQRPSQNPATTNQPNSQNRILTIDKASFVAQRPRLDLVAACGGTPNHRRDHEPFEQRGGCRCADNDGLHRRATQSFAGAFLLPALCWSSASSPTSSSSSSAGWRRSRIRRPR